MNRLKESEFNKNLVEILFLIYFEYLSNTIIFDIDSKNFRNTPYKFSIKSSIQILIKLVQITSFRYGSNKIINIYK
jgi:hypothetical protein